MQKCTSLSNKICSVTQSLLTEEREPSKGLLDLLHIIGERHDWTSLGSINAAIKAAGWQSKVGTERWDFELPKKFSHLTKDIIKICHDELGMRHSVLPKPEKYDGVLFLGAALQRVMNRLDFYQEQLKSGAIDKDLTLFVLTGDRELSISAGETADAFYQIARTVPGDSSVVLPTNELEMIKYVFLYKMEYKPNIRYIYSLKDKMHTRATTASTFIKFLEEYDNSYKDPCKQSNFLVISNQPYIEYQNSVLDLLLHKNHRSDINIYTIGNGIKHEIIDEQKYCAQLLDTIAKTIANFADMEA